MKEGKEWAGTFFRNFAKGGQNRHLHIYGGGGGARVL